jgi:hypothetical protein
MPFVKRFFISCPPASVPLASSDVYLSRAREDSKDGALPSNFKAGDGTMEGGEIWENNGWIFVRLTIIGIGNS